MTTISAAFSSQSGKPDKVPVSCLSQLPFWGTWFRGRKGSKAQDKTPSADADGGHAGASIHVSPPFLCIRGRALGVRAVGAVQALTWGVRCLSSINLKQIPIAWRLSGQISDLI